MGTGAYDSATGKFSGDMKCAGYADCGSQGYKTCGESVSCAWQFAYVYYKADNFDGIYFGSIVDVSAIPVLNVTKKW